MSDFDSIDFFTDQSFIPDPFLYFDHLRAKGPVVKLPHHGVVAVTGHAEALEVYRATRRSRRASVSGVRFRRCRSNRTAMTSVGSARRIASRW